ncbi:50S ribosomal protein L25/general stress protein Ctc [Micrococcoides hystricis]|uniref:Large ribosomal subunit protein bL25 n=1 Tax=Micrococcoides hystricis TaxID=1572761 RepID=A0ABV6PAB7_9MICC
MSANKILIPAEKRTESGKGAARRARRDGKVPAVVYGHGTEPQHLLLPAHQTFLAVRNPNALLTLDIEGEEQMVLPKEIQRDVIREDLLHVDLLIVRRGEKVIVDVAVNVEGEPAPNTVFNLEEVTVSVEAEATNLPDSVTINIEGREAGEHVYAADIITPEGATVQLEDDYVIATISEPVEVDLGETDEDEAAEAAEGAPAAEAEEADEE